MADNSTNKGGVGVCGLLGILFVALKLLEKIDWPWVWVLAPFWIPLLVALAVIALVGIGVVIYSLLKN